MPEDPLALDVETMRRLGYRTIDLLVERLADPAGGPALRRATPAEMTARLGGPPPVDGAPMEDVLEQLWRDVIPYASRCEHPRYFAFIPACGTWPGALGDLISSALNPYVGSWMESAGPSQVELEVLRWFAEWIGYPAGTAGILVSGGSQANMTALACAREARLGMMSDGAVVYVTDQAHSSLARAARVLGFQPHQVRVLPADARLRMPPRALADAMAADLRMGRTPLFVTAMAGSTNAGAVDPLTEIADVCAAHGAWMHVDAAYGGFACLTERGARALAGIERADSVTLDPHKWLYQPFECGCLLVRDGPLLRAAFEITPDYLADAEVEDAEVNFADLGMQLTRGFRALKVWLSLRTFGTRAFAAAIDGCLDLALTAQAAIERAPELELLSPASLGIVCFRRHPPGLDDEATLDRCNARLVAGFAESGRGLVSSTRLRGSYAVRMCILNHTSTAADVDEVLGWFAGEPVDRSAGEAPAPAAAQRDSGVFPALGAAAVAPVAVPDPERVDPESLRDLPLFAKLDAGSLERVGALARAGAAAAGESVVEEWGLGRDFYVVLAGTAAVLRAEVEINRLGVGDFFGEFAALEWGASFAYSRLATVVALTPLRLAVFTPEALTTLMVELPNLEREITRVRRERLLGVQRADGDAQA
jgi:aromatic-L-amino-acid decarboxylase